MAQRPALCRRSQAWRQRPRHQRADGALVRLGSRTHKNKTGFDLGRLFVGSEGMLGIVTEATLKLLPLPPFRAALSVGFATMKKSGSEVRSRILSIGTPSTRETTCASVVSWP